jgi:hypothetical protein
LPSGLILRSADHSLAIWEIRYGSNPIPVTLQSDWWCQNRFRAGCLRRCWSHGASPWVNTGNWVRAKFLCRFSKAMRLVVSVL